MVVHSSLLSWRDRYLKKLKDQSQNNQNRRSGGKQVTYMKRIKYSHAPWESYLHQRI